MFDARHASLAVDGYRRNITTITPSFPIHVMNHCRLDGGCGGPIVAPATSSYLDDRIPGQGMTRASNPYEAVGIECHLVDTRAKSLRRYAAGAFADLFGRAQ